MIEHDSTFVQLVCNVAISVPTFVFVLDDGDLCLDIFMLIRHILPLRVIVKDSSRHLSVFQQDRQIIFSP